MRKLASLQPCFQGRDAAGGTSRNCSYRHCVGFGLGILLRSVVRLGLSQFRSLVRVGGLVNKQSYITTAVGE